MTLFLDGVVADLVAGLKANAYADLWQNTLLVFLSDNGGPVYGGKFSSATRSGARARSWFVFWRETINLGLLWGLLGCLRAHPM